MDKKVKGYMINHGGWIEFDQAPDENGPWVPCIMVISDKSHERVFTESEVKLIMREAFHGRTGQGQGITWLAMVKAAQAFGIVLDPA